MHLGKICEQLLHHANNKHNKWKLIKKLVSQLCFSDLWFFAWNTICLLNCILYSFFFPQSDKNSKFLMTYLLMHFLCNVHIHIWKENNSQHKYLMRTFYSPTSHISINCKCISVLTSHNVAIYHGNYSLGYIFVCFASHKNKQHKSLVRLCFPSITLWKPY